MQMTDNASDKTIFHWKFVFRNANYRETYNISGTQSQTLYLSFSSRLAVVFVQSIEAMC